MGKNGKEHVPDEVMRAVFILENSKDFNGSFEVDDLNLSFIPTTQAFRSLDEMRCIDRQGSQCELGDCYPTNCGYGNGRYRSTCPKIKLDLPG